MPRTRKILLISANRHCEPYPVYPLGLSYLKTYLARNLAGFEVDLLDCNLDSQDDLRKYILAENPCFIGISLRNADKVDSLDRGGGFIDGYREIVETVRGATDAPVCIGGSAFSIFPEVFLKALGADYGITSEGEESLLKLITALDHGKDASGIEGVTTAEGGTIRINPRKCYLKSPVVDFDDRLTDHYWKHSGMLNIQTKRGCPYSCVYCSYPVIDGRIVRTLDAEAVVDSIARLKNSKGVNYFFFTDSVFNIAEKYNIELAEKLVRSGAGISWGAYFSPHRISRDVMELYKASGLTHVEFGTESISDECLGAYNKGFTVDDVMNASQVCLDLNIYYAHFLIFGGYGETPRTLEETIENSRKIRYSVFFPYAGMRIYPRTELHRIAVNESIVTADDDLFEPVYYIAKDFDLEKAKQMARATGKAWVFPDEPHNVQTDGMRTRLNKKGPLWEYLRKP